jgi:hypothetical protein
MMPVRLTAPKSTIAVTYGRSPSNCGVVTCTTVYVTTVPVSGSDSSERSASAQTGQTSRGGSELCPFAHVRQYPVPEASAVRDRNRSIGLVQVGRPKQCADELANPGFLPFLQGVFVHIPLDCPVRLGTDEHLEQCRPLCGCERLNDGCERGTDMIAVLVERFEWFESCLPVLFPVRSAFDLDGGRRLVGDECRRPLDRLELVAGWKERAEGPFQWVV